MENILFMETITQPKSLLGLLPLFIVILVIIGLMLGIIFSIKNTNISIKDNEVVIRSFLYGRKIPLDNILKDEVQAINLKQNNEYNISIRTNGISLPNLNFGWMRLNNGNRALVFLTNRENVLLMPTKDFVVLFSMKKTEEFISKLK